MRTIYRLLAVVRPPGEMDVVGRGAPHAGLVVVHVSPGQRGHAAVNVSLEVSGQRGGAVAEPVPLVHPQLAGC